MKALLLILTIFSSSSWATGNGVTSPSTGLLEKDEMQQRQEANERADIMEQKKRIQKESPLKFETNKADQKIKEKGDTGY